MKEGTSAVALPAWQVRVFAVLLTAAMPWCGWVSVELATIKTTLTVVSDGHSRQLDTVNGKQFDFEHRITLLEREKVGDLGLKPELPAFAPAAPGIEFGIQKTGLKSPPWLTQPPTGWTSEATIVDVHDGDTLKVEIRRQFTLRLLECWAPELSEKAGPPSRDALIKLCQGPDGKWKSGRMFITADGNVQHSFTFGRALAHFWVDGDDKSISQHQVETGNALRSDPRGKHKDPEF